MKAKILMVEDDKNFSDALKEFFEATESKHEIIIEAFRTVEEAEVWLKDTSKSQDLKICILDLMFPPKDGDIDADIGDLAQGLVFYEKYLKNKIKTMILTAALRRTHSEKLVKQMIKDDPGTTLVKKPMEDEQIEESILDCLERDAWS